MKKSKSSITLFLPLTFSIFVVLIVLLLIGFKVITNGYITHPIDLIQSSGKEMCEENNGTWYESDNECEFLPNESNQMKCENLGGEFNHCASPCRHDPRYPDVICIESCAEICILK